MFEIKTRDVGLQVLLLFQRSELSELVFQMQTINVRFPKLNCCYNVATLTPANAAATNHF